MTLGFHQSSLVLRMVNEMLLVRLPETGEEFIHDKLTDIELNLISGLYIVSMHMYVSGGIF